MDWLILAGTALALAGLGGLIYCIVVAMKARKAGLDDGELRARLQRLVVWNMAALLCSMMGLALVVVGIFLG